MILISKYGASFHSFFRVPNNKTVAEQVPPLAVHFEMNLKLPVSNVAWLNKQTEAEDFNTTG